MGCNTDGIGRITGPAETLGFGVSWMTAGEAAQRLGHGLAVASSEQYRVRCVRSLAFQCAVDLDDDGAEVLTSAAWARTVSLGARFDDHVRACLRLIVIAPPLTPIELVTLARHPDVLDALADLEPQETP